ncbi:unnamed protein product [Eruca vesicaria subsp. sativa]|uniref:Uncharacterized protein n=1 Tax=Eruca vesicaria subsp. sativa TaxID=29727 RepID=A0ABC8IYC7_ERUVS|nr:unnamed protein product [Eruca vesicaria subsp. sativa]
MAATPMEGKWVQLKQKGTGPGARSSHAIALVGNKVYAFGGEFQPRPENRSYHSITTDSQNVYVFGGCGVDGRLNDLWAYNVVDEKWIKFPSPGEGCKGRGGPGLEVVEGKIWVVYGFTGDEADNVHCFDIGKGEWKEVETKGEKPSARSVFSTALDRGALATRLKSRGSHRLKQAKKGI